MSKITMATVKSWVKKNQGNIFIQVFGRFDGTTDGWTVVNMNAFLKKAETTPFAEYYERNTLGIDGAYFVRNRGDLIERYEINGKSGFKVYNCCRSFAIVA